MIITFFIIIVFMGQRIREHIIIIYILHYIHGAVPGKEYIAEKILKSLLLYIYILFIYYIHWAAPGKDCIVGRIF